LIALQPGRFKEPNLEGLTTAANRIPWQSHQRGGGSFAGLT
jgi:hypothetical protein